MNILGKLCFDMYNVNQNKRDFFELYAGEENVSMGTIQFYFQNKNKIWLNITFYIVNLKI